MSDSDVTVCITSYNRFDLLKQTIDSFVKLNNYPIARIAVIEDSTLPEMKDKVIKEYGSDIDLIFNETRLGQAPSLDKIYKTVTTKYIFHTEDDYLYVGNPNFVAESRELLEEKSDIHQVWCRHFDNFVVSHGTGWHHQFEDEILHSKNGIPYKMLRANYANWCGFSWNPGLRRTEDYLKMFPKGFAEFIGPEYLISGVQTEARCNINAGKQGYRAASLINGACKNMGIGRETYL